MLLISNMYPSKKQPSYGTFVKNFVYEMSKYNINFNFVLIKGKGKNKIEKVFKYLHFYTTIIFKVLFTKYDVIYIHYFTHSAIPFILLQYIIQKPIIINVHGHDITVRNKLEKFLLNLSSSILQNVDMIVVPSKYFKSLSIEVLKIDEEKVFVSPSGGVDLNLFFPKKDYNKSTFTIGYVSRIDHGKGWETLINSLPKILQTIPDIKVIIVGGGSEISSLLSKISSMNLDHNIEVMGSIKHELLYEQYYKMDLFIFPTELNESLGLVGLEAMACGIPVIASNIGGINDYLIDGYNGYFFKSGNILDLEEKITMFYSQNDNIKNQMSTNCVETAKDFSSKRTSEKLFIEIEKLIQDSLK